ncbi:MAG: NUDIX domain-containing protein [Promethearchaeota archaeon]
MKRKILTFVVKGRKFLALEMTKHPEHAPEGGWFVVTGGVEGNESSEDAVAREIFEETGLNIEESIFLNWSSIYEWRDELCEEKNFIAFVNHEEVILNEEHSDYQWLSLDEFIKKINWDDDKELLKKVLKKAIKKERYFDKINVKDYRRKNE